MSVVLFAGVLAAALPVAGPVEAAFPGQNGRIVYWTTIFPHGDLAAGRNQIFTIGQDGTGQRRLTRRGSSDSPRWAPHGHRIAYRHAALRGPTYETSHIWVMGGTVGAHKLQLTFGRQNWDTAPAWAPDGLRIVFVRFAGRAKQDLFVYSFDTRRATPLQVGDGFNRIPDSPAWSPDGRTIVFSAGHKSDVRCIRSTVQDSPLLTKV